MKLSTQRIAAEIRRYCVAHPNACDTVEGIAWWVRMQREEDVKNSVADAVKWLVEQGLLERFRLRDGTAVFGCRECRKGEKGR